MKTRSFEYASNFNVCAAQPPISLPLPAPRVNQSAAPAPSDGAALGGLAFFRMAPRMTKSSGDSSPARGRELRDQSLCAIPIKRLTRALCGTRDRHGPDHRQWPALDVGA